MLIAFGRSNDRQLIQLKTKQTFFDRTNFVFHLAKLALRDNEQNLTVYFDEYDYVL